MLFVRRGTRQAHTHHGTHVLVCIYVSVHTRACLRRCDQTLTRDFSTRVGVGSLKQVLLAQRNPIFYFTWMGHTLYTCAHTPSHPWIRWIIGYSHAFLLVSISVDISIMDMHAAHPHAHYMYSRVRTTVHSWTNQQYQQQNKMSPQTIIALLPFLP